MRKSLTSIVFLFLTAFIIQSCKKTNNNSGSTPSLNQLFSGLRSNPQNYTVTAGTSQTIVADSGTIFHFYPNSFKDANGNIINNGTINVQLIEMTSVGVMILNRATTTGNGNTLTSGGEIFIYATMAGNEVYANKYGVAFAQPGASKTSMSLYYGSTQNEDSIALWTNTSTLPGETASGTIIDSSHLYNGNSYYYNFDSATNFSWVNCDAVCQDVISSQLTTVSIVLPDNSFNASNTQVFLVLPTDISIFNLSFYNSTSNTFSLNDDGSQVPIGLKYDIVVIANKNGSYFYFETSGTTFAGMSINAPVAPEIMGDIITRVSGL